VSKTRASSATTVVGQSRATQRRTPKVRDDDAALTDGIVRLAKQYGRYGYRRIREMLAAEGWRVSVKRVYRIWRRLLDLLASGETAESPKEAAETRPSLAQRRIMHPPEARAAQPCLEL
jgi:hypothetical protein